MWPLCTARPKPLLAVAGRSLLERAIDELQAVGVGQVTVVAPPGAPGGLMRRAVRARPGLRLEWRTQAQPLGTGHAVAAARVAEDALVVMGDALLDREALQRLAAHLEAGRFALGVAKVPDVSRFGAVATQGGRLRALEEKRGSGAGWANTGMYAVPADALRAARGLEPSPRGELEFTDVVARFATAAGVRTVTAKGWLDVGRPWDLLEAQDLLMEPSMDFLADRAAPGGPGCVAGPGTVDPGVTVRGRLFVAAGATVKSGTYVEGDVHVGAGAVVGPNAYLRGPVSVGEGGKVGAACEVKASALLPGAHVPHLSYVGDSVLGEGCNLGAGTIVANLKHSGRTVAVDHKGARVDTGRRKLGAIVGDGAKTGIGTRLGPGSMVAPGAWTSMGQVVTGTWLGEVAQTRAKRPRHG